MYLSNVLFGFPLLLFTEPKIFNGLLPIHPAIIKVLVVLSYGLINHVSDDHFQTEKIEASDPIYWAFPTLSLKKLVLKCINVTAKDKQ